MVDRPVVLDANVLIPSAPRDTLLRAAEAGLFRPRWSAEILAEAERNLIEHEMTSHDGARRLIETLNRAFPTAAVRGYDEIMESLTNDPKDRHVLATAIQANADVVVTQNISDFPRSSTSRYGISAVTIDEFLIQLHELGSSAIHQIIQDQAVELTRPPLTYNDVLDNLEIIVPRFSALMRVH